MIDFARITPSEFCDLLRELGIQRAYVVWDRSANRARASHAVLQPLADWLAQDPRDFDRHEGLFLQVARETGSLQAAFVHRTCRGQGAGGLRFWRYDTFADFLRDGLRLSRGMTQKNALAGLWWGGGKGVIARNTGQDAADPDVRRHVYEEYGSFVTSLNGCYITAEDVGTNVDDMAAVFSRTRFAICIPPALGGSGNPSAPTAHGVVRGMEAALAFQGRGSLAGKSIAVQGLGNVGTPLIGRLIEHGVGRIVGVDIDRALVEGLRRRFPAAPLDLTLVERGDDRILEAEVDIFAPCATGAILGPATISRLRAPIVCGAANNQLEDPQRDDVALQERGILYMPDFLVNRMGIVNCADEHAGYVDPDPIFAAHLGDDWEGSVYNVSIEVLRLARETGQTPHRVALQMADEKARELHPIFGHRGQQIIDSIVRKRWAI